MKRWIHAAEVNNESSVQKYLDANSDLIRDYVYSILQLDSSIDGNVMYDSLVRLITKVISSYKGFTPLDLVILGCTVTDDGNIIVKLTKNGVDYMEGLISYFSIDVSGDIRPARKRDFVNKRGKIGWVILRPADGELEVRHNGPYQPDR